MVKLILRDGLQFSKKVIVFRHIRGLVGLEPYERQAKSSF